MPHPIQTTAIDPDAINTNVDSTKPGFRPGNITRVQMKNFLTFSDTVFKPGPRMNLIIGPNGTGKSTIVSAVCIVFCGKPTILGRNPDLGSFVKFGTTEASVEAWLYEPTHPRGHISVRRVFNSDGKGYYLLDNVRVKQMDIMEKVVQQYDIQLDNLSQFMPQEKIAEFTNHRPDELLKLAVRSLGGVEREEFYADLIEQDKKFQNNTDTLKQNQAQLETLEDQQRNDEQEVQTFKAQKVLREKLKILEAFRPVVAEIELRATYNKIRDAMKAMEVQIAELDQHMQLKASGSINACKQTLERAKEAFTVARTTTQHAERNNDKNLSLTEDLSTKLTQKTKDVTEVDLSAERTRKGIETAEEKLADSEAQYKNTDLSSEEELSNRQRSLEGKRSEFRSYKRDEENKKAPLEQEKLSANRALRHFQASLDGLGDARRQRMEIIGRMSNGREILECERLMQDLRRKNAFEKRVHGPVLLEIEVTNSYHARIMEHSVSGFLMTAFVTETGRDSRVLIDACRHHFKGWVADTITAPTTRNDEVDFNAINAQRANRPVDERLRNLGIECTVSDIYAAPDPVRAALNAQAALHTIYVGSERAAEAQDDLRFERGIMTWYTPESRCQVSGSRFDPNAKNLRVDTSFVNTSGQVYSGNVAEAERKREDLKHRIRAEEDKVLEVNNQLTGIEQAQAKLTAQVREIEKDIQQVVEKRIEQRKCWETVENMKRHVDELKNRAARKDVVKEKSRLSEEIHVLEEKVVHAVVRLSNGLKKLHEAVHKVDETFMDKTHAERTLATEEAVHAEAISEVEGKKKERASLKSDRDRVKAEWRRKKELSDRALTEDQAKEYAEMLNPYYELTADHLEVDIANLEGQVAGLTTGGPGVIEAYEHRKRRIDRLQREIEKHRSHFEMLQQELKERKDEFLIWLQAGIERMRYKFSSLYARLGCSGDLRLTNIESGALGDLTLEVLVSYRNDVELRPVSAMANSGGEKMCCTMIFCFSLQLEEERIPPFIMVDELNQGLDPSNEMKIMTMMIEDASKQTASQSFVITPKLLPNLPLGTFTKTHIIFNGPVKAKDDILSG